MQETSGQSSAGLRARRAALQVARARLDRAPIDRVSVGNPDVADILVLRARELYVLGKDLGTTNVLLWNDDDQLIGSVAVEVTHDLDGLKRKLFELFPAEQIDVYAAQRSIVLSGSVSSVAIMDAALQLARRLSRAGRHGRRRAGSSSSNRRAAKIARAAKSST